ncbi:hypothetical protein [Arthrobacter sp. H35-D1]|uniref:hypothetical protein n=1 Tax=Arthrobacter sp. H35-D1 TaxID=3046202 RepID=UPI0032D56B8C
MSQASASESAVHGSTLHKPASGSAQPGTTRVFAGHNRISAQALTSVAKVAAAEVLLVPPAQVRVRWSDEAGALALAVSSAMGAPSVTEVRRHPGIVEQGGGSVLARATAAKARILAQVEELTGSQLSRVDVRISGLLVREGGRVL